MATWKRGWIVWWIHWCCWMKKETKTPTSRRTKRFAAITKSLDKLKRSPEKGFSYSRANMLSEATTPMPTNNAVTNNKAENNCEWETLCWELQNINQISKIWCFWSNVGTDYLHWIRNRPAAGTSSTHKAIEMVLAWLQDCTWQTWNFEV